MNTKTTNLIDLVFLSSALLLIAIFGLIISVPYTELLISVGLYIFWLFLLFLPTYMLVISSLKLGSNGQAISLSWQKLKISTGKIIKIAIVQFAYFGILSFIIRGGNLGNSFTMIVRWFRSIGLSEVINKPETTFNYFNDWLNSINLSASATLVIPPIVALVAYMAVAYLVAKIIFVLLEII